MLRGLGWKMNTKRVARISRSEGLKIPTKQPKRCQLWLNDGSCVWLRPEYTNHVWSYALPGRRLFSSAERDFVEERTHDGGKYRMLNIIDEFTRECIAIKVNRRFNATDVIDVISDLFILYSIPGHI
jgi:putative transposase